MMHVMMGQECVAISKQTVLNKTKIIGHSDRSTHVPRQAFDIKITLKKLVYPLRGIDRLNRLKHVPHIIT